VLPPQQDGPGRHVGVNVDKIEARQEILGAAIRGRRRADHDR
jgi:hypothetical protein